MTAIRQLIHQRMCRASCSDAKAILALHSDLLPARIDVLVLGSTPYQRRAILKLHVSDHLDLIETTLSSTGFDSAVPPHKNMYLTLHDSIVSRAKLTDPLRAMHQEAFRRTVAYEASVACGYHNGANAALALELESLDKRAAAGNPEPAAPVAINGIDGIHVDFAAEPSPIDRICNGLRWPMDVTLLAYSRIVSASFVNET